MLLYKIRRRIAAFILGANALTILGGASAYICISYILLFAAGEKDLVAPEVFFYWMMVTASTVGYGDYSPVTMTGRIVTAVFVIPFGLSLFAICIGKIGYYFSEIVHKGKRGLRMTRATNHCVIVGWNGTRTLRLINLLLTKQNCNQEKILLCHDQPMENPLPDKIEFTQVDGFTDPDSMKRAAINEATRIIIDTEKDDITLATALFCQNENKDAHITVYFKDESHSDLIRSYCPKVEVVPSVSVELLARASVDPGSATLHQNLLDPSVDASQYSIEYTNEESPFSALIPLFRSKHQAIPIAVKRQVDEEVDINPEDDVLVSKGDIVYYIADKRISNL